MNPSGETFLISNQNADGGWGYAPQQSSLVEPTSAAVLALKEGPSGAPSRGLAIEWLRNAQHIDGGWGFSAGDAESAWQTAWAVLALVHSGQARNAISKGGEWLLSVKAIQFGKDAMQFSKKILRIDYSLRGWPWLPGEASWIEPTSLTLLALDSGSGMTAATKRMNEALRYIQDRRCSGGGWNMGNPVMFDSALPARVSPTALVLLALSRLAPGSILDEDIKALRHEMHRDNGVLGLSWGLLALRTIGQDDTLARARLIAMQGGNGGWANNPYFTAVALMALRGHL